MKLSLAVIAKDEINQIDRIIRDYRQYFDELVFAVDDQAVFDACISAYHQFPEIKFYKYEWVNDFSHKRNFLAGKITGDYYVRIDTDDAFLNPDRIRPLAEFANNNKYTVVMCFYIYSKDDDGNPNATQYRETIIKNTGSIYWNKKIHECILPRSIANYKVHIDETLRIDHLIDFEHARKSIIRNLEYLIAEYNQNKENTDPRTIAYLGRTFFTLKDFDKAIFFLQKHIQGSGWDEDRYTSWCYLSEIFNHKKDFEKAIACANEALAERPSYPDAYFKLHDIYFQMGAWDKSIAWGETGFTKEMPKSMMVLDPSAWTWRPALSMAFCYLQTGDVDKAYKFFSYAKKLAPTIAWVKENEPVFKKAIQEKVFAEQFHNVYKFLKARNPENLKLLTEAIPDDIDVPILTGLKRLHSDPRDWKDNEICIICPMSAEPWSPESIKTGIGGSEEAVIRLSEQFNKLGYKVTVYNDCSKEGNYDGVKYVDWKKLNIKDRFSTVISWRSNIFNYGIVAKNRIIWLHDGIPADFFNEDELKRVDKIVVLSQYHKTLLPKIVPEEKIYVSANGIVPEDFAGIKEVRNPHRLIWASSYDRGLEVILSNWQKIRAEIPDAEIHCFYGWNTYDSLVAEGQRKSDFKPRMLELMKQDGVFEHGRIGHKELLKEYAKSGMWAYPCNYKGEIQCIALTKAVASGCVCVTNDFAVLPERNPHYIADNEHFIDKIIDVLKHDSFVQGDVSQYIQDNSWEKIAKEWEKDLFKSEYPVEVIDRIAWIRTVTDVSKKIVDIGCNEGHLFAGYDRKNITSVDIDLYDIPNFVRADAQSLPFGDKTFDIAVLGEVVEHCPDPLKAVTEARRVAKQVIVTVPYEQKWTSILDPMMPIEKKLEKERTTAVEIAKSGNPKAKDFYTEDNFQHLYHSHFFTPKTLEKLLKDAGFEKYRICEIRRDDFVWLGAICE
ncbi:MAG TPA: methyltransferase domain-containing protein [Candidatus Cloacimonas sp.]|nr:methyltransferase domain-containing protein [Candidatus Cloacimonas sp.]